ncbi:EAL and GGDEF domain-containing protein [Meiothermus hypogaeus]|uniref:GGDEF domain-containing protein n=2 Tax=Meiothermus hypogaeus TaxID=884155 RepID=A0A511R6J9_9DEIN|nr:bifunctional diguanylate cyclase/phosphodiesterase [Meiothermus hypogaeus]RIH77998.1 putative signaling protein [Meiothermus hypogaeus]GEM85170.1 hypothetical protein MHY01S_33360 [Meiothermus hypogaeus NBRC 106114]
MGSRAYGGVWLVAVLLSAVLLVWGVVARWWGWALVCALLLGLLAWLYWRLVLREGRRALQEHQADRVFDEMELLVVRLDRQGRIVFCNRYLLELTGWTWPQLAGQNWFDWFIPAEEGVREIFERAMENGDLVPQYKNNILTRNKERRRVLWNNSLLRDENGRVIGTFSVGQDVTDLEKAEQERLRSEKLLWQIAETVQDVVLLTDANAHIQYATPSIHPVAGWKPEEVVGRSVYSQLDSEQQRIFERMTREATPEKHVTQVGFSYQHPDGQQRILEASINFLFSPEGVFQGVEVGIRDVTQRYQAEQAVRESEQRLRELTNSMRDVVMLLSVKGVIEYVTPSVKAALGYDPDELLGRSAFEFFDPEDHGWVLEAVRAAREGRRPLRLEYQHRHRDGSRIWLETQLDYIYDPEGQPLRMVLGARQIQDRREAEEQLRQSEQMLRQITNAMQDVVALTDPLGYIRYVTPSVERLLGYKPGQMLGQLAFDFLAPEDGAKAMLLAEQCLAGGGGYHIEARYRHAEGHYIWIDTLVNFITDEKGNPIGSVVSGRDVTERRQAEEALREREYRLSQITNSIQDVVLLLDPYGRVQYATPSVTQVLGFAPEELVGRPVSVLADAAQWRAIRQQGRQAIQERRACKIECSCRHKDGHRVWIESLVNFVWDESGVLQGVVVGMRDTSERKQQQAYVEYMAYHDELTKLPNRRALRRAAEELLSKAAVQKIPISLLYLDLDNFKTVNDTLGHDVGDELLVEVSQVLSKQLRTDDMLARLGGDEFACILYNTEPEQAQQVAFRMARAIRGALGGDNFSLKLPSLGVSVGIASFPKDGSSFVELLKVADIAMYQAKDSGSRVVIYDAAKSPYTDERLQFEADLRKATQEQQLQLLYQPIWHLKERRLEGAEALLCWPYQGKLLSASEFVPLAEEVHLIEQMDLLALGKGLEQLKRWQQLKLPYRLSLNISTQSLVQPEVVRELLRALTDAQVDPQWLTLEITESVLLHDPNQARRVLSVFKALGVRVAIDDFGSGYASLGYLRQLPLDRLKIDRSFISYLGSSVRDEKLIRAAIDLAHSLEAEVVAEGVETPEQLEWLLENDCDLVQGYLMGHPAPIEHWPPPGPIERWLLPSIKADD